MRTVMDRMPAFTVQAGARIPNRRPGARGDVAALINAFYSRDTITVVTPAFAVNVTVEGVTSAFGDDVWIEPYGWVSMWVADGWLVVAIDAHPDLPDIELRLDAERVAAVLADIALARCVEQARQRGGAA